MTDTDKTSEKENPPEIITFEDFTHFDFEKSISQIAPFEISGLFSQFSKAANDAFETSDNSAYRVLKLLEALCSIHFTPEDTGRVWGPMMEWDGRRSALPSDFEGEQNNVFVAIAPNIRHPALRARISDIAWVNNRKLGETAILAINAYCECIEKYSEVDSTHTKGNEFGIFNAVDCLQRALQIAYATSKRGVTPERVSKALHLLYERTRSENAYAAYLKTAKLALYYSQISESDIANHAEELAEKAVDQYPIAIKSTWEMAAHLHGKLGNDDAKRRCQLGAVEQILRMRAQVSGAGAEAHWIMEALQALRHIADTDEMEDALESDLRRLQKASIKEMGSFPLELEVSGEREETVKQFSKFTLPEALLNFARISSSPDLNYLKKQALDAAKRTPLMAMIGISHVDDEGKVIRKSESADISKGPNESWFIAQISRNEDIRRLFVVASLIDPARQTIFSSHCVAEKHLDPIVACSSFVPDSQKQIWCIGLLRYFQSDYISAAHLLLPQMESSLRHILKLNGISPVKRFDDGTEEDLDLGGMLSRKRTELDEILSASLAAEIERIFHLRPGPALRHDLAHGLLSSGQCSGHDVNYAIWLMYKLCVAFAHQNWDKVIAPYLISLTHPT